MLILTVESDNVDNHCWMRQCWY